MAFDFFNESRESHDFHTSPTPSTSTLEQMGGTSYEQYFDITKDSKEHHALLKALKLSSLTPVVKLYGIKLEYHCYFSQGLSLCFESGKLESIDFYKNQKPSSSSPVGNSEPYSSVKPENLPDFIGFNMTGKQLIEKFGEPVEKGGGLSQKLDIWLRWSGFQVEIGSRDWDAAKDIEWSSLTIFKK